MDARNLIRRAMVVSWLAALALAAPADRSFAGATWEFFDLAEGEFINLATDGTYLYAVANDYTASGIYRRYLDHPDSSWVQLSGLEGEVLFDVWASPAQPGVVFVGNEAPFVTPGAADLYRSDDAGLTWTASDTGIATDITGSPGVVVVAGSPFDPDLLLVWADTLFRSDDGGATWSCGTDFGCNALFGGPTSRIIFDPFLTGRVWLPMSTGFETYLLHRSDDDGETWNGSQTPWIGDLAVSAISGRMYRTSSTALSTSVDGGDTWEPIFDTADDWLRAIGLSPWNDDDIVLGQQRADGGERLGWISRDAGASWLPFDEGLPDSVEAITQLLPDPVRVGVYYAATGPDNLGNGLHGAVWRGQLESVVGVAGDAPDAATSRLVVRANPARRTATFTLAGESSAELAGDVRIFDTSGRHAGTARRVGARGSGTFRWDGRDATGGVAAPGTYFAIHERSGATARFVWLGR